MPAVRSVQITATRTATTTPTRTCATSRRERDRGCFGVADPHTGDVTRPRSCVDHRTTDAEEQRGRNGPLPASRWLLEPVVPAPCQRHADGAPQENLGSCPGQAIQNPKSPSSILFVAKMSVAEAARRLGVGVPRIHQRIRDGSLRAERLGSQWVVDELSLLHVAERKEGGRPLSARSAWAIIAVAEGDEVAIASLAAAERSRAKARLEELLSLVAKPARSEQAVRRVASALRLQFRNRARMQSYKAAVDDLPQLRADLRWESVIDAAARGIASSDVDGYLAPHNVDALVRQYLLVPAAADVDANVVMHVLPEGQKPYPDSLLRLAIDLADLRGPREELRAAELLHDVAARQKAVRQ